MLPPISYPFYPGSRLNFYPFFFFFNDTATTEIYTLSLHDALPISLVTTRHKSDDDLKGLVYALTPRLTDHEMVWYKRPATLAVVVLGLTLVLNVIFW